MKVSSAPLMAAWQRVVRVPCPVCQSPSGVPCGTFPVPWMHGLRSEAAAGRFPPLSPEQPSPPSTTQQRRKAVPARNQHRQRGAQRKEP